MRRPRLPEMESKTAEPSEMPTLQARAEQSAPADRTEDHVEIWCILEQLQHGGALADVKHSHLHPVRPAMAGNQ